MPVSMPEKRRHSLILWADHHNIHIWVLAIAVFVVNDLWPNIFTDILNWIAVTMVLVLVLFSIMHKGFICPRCINEIPSDPPTIVAKRARILRMWHRINDHPQRTLTLLFIFPTIMLLKIWWPPLANIGPWLLDAYVLFQLHVTNVHRPLIDWCPQCRNDGGGRFEESPSVPDPVPSATVDV